MNLSINPRHFLDTVAWEDKRNILEAVALTAAAGFSHFDLEAESEEEAEILTDYMQKNNFSVIQSHMPFNRYKREPSDVFHKNVMAYAEYAKRMDSKILVVHADEFDYRNQPYTTKAALEYNYRFFYDLVDYAAANGMRVAFENTFQEPTMTAKPHFCALTDELLSLLERYGTDTVGICWDTGHARVQYGNHDMQALKLVGEKVICTHIHDNYYNQDLHCFPFMGNIDWKTLMMTLKAYGYTGDLSFELVYDRLPKALALDYLKLLYRSGEYMLSELI
ncbi:MAG: sugar phosphate isomerase/epimerase [Clostridia bacterium]|nr:sugar phosphate isomerase/epimerase [Clostridia bacterium]